MKCKDFMLDFKDLVKSDTDLGDEIRTLIWIYERGQITMNETLRLIGQYITIETFGENYKEE